MSADQIKQLSGREPRLMTKFDTREYRPDPIKHAGCTILPVRNGEYALLRGDGYCDLSPSSTPSSFLSPLRRQLETFPRECRSESEAIDAAFVYGIIQDFIGDDDIVLTMRGRRRTPRFAFKFSNPESARLEVDGVQVEIDSGYEGDKVYVLEAKMGARDNFIVRQLFYPARMCAARGLKKTVVPLFMTYSNQTFAFSEYRFLADDNYSSISHVRSASYFLETEGPRTLSLREILESTPEGPEPRGVPFPQANDVRKVIDVLDAVLIGLNAKADITRRYEFASRQASYYGDAARYLGLLQAADGAYALTNAGAKLGGLSARRKTEAVIRAMARRPVLRHGLEHLETTGGPPDAAFFEPLIEEMRPEVGGTTVPRRAQATARWMEWVAANLQVLG